VANTYMAARVVFSLAHLLLSPRAPQLRLIRFSDAVAGAFIAWLRRVMLVGVGGYALAEAGRFLGLPWAAYDAILNLTLLVISLFMVRIVLQQRHAVAAVLRAPPLGPEEQPDRTRLLLRALRDRLAEVWHILVILWLAAGWIVWALALENGFERLLTGTGLTLLVAGLAKGLDEGIGRLLEQALHPGPELARRYPGLPARAGFYVPMLRAVVSVVIGFGTLVLLLETWGLDALDWFAEGTLGYRLLGTLLSIGITLVLALLVWEAANTAIQRRLTRLARDSQAARSARVRTLLPMLRTVIGVVILVFVVLNALAQLGVNVAPLLAGAGVIGLAIGFGSQTLVRDVITGGFLLLEDAVAVGDVVQLGGLSGVVEHLSVRSIKLRAQDGSVHIVPFSAVTTVTNMTRDFAFAVLDVTVSYREDTDRVCDVLREISAEIRAEPKWGPVIRDEIDVFGVERLADSGVVIRARVKTEPAARWNVGREFNRRIKQRFDALGIEIPYPHQKLLVEETEPRHPAAPRRAAE
jgi:moderate conductance mechanosensitive channel